MTIQVQQGVGGLDTAASLADLFKQQSVRQEEINRAHLDALTAVAQGLLGGTGRPTGPNAGTAAFLASAASVPASASKGTMIGGGSATAGQTTVQSLQADQNAQAAAAANQGYTAPPAPPTTSVLAASRTGGGIGNPLAGQTTTGGPGGAGAPPGGGRGGWVPPNVGGSGGGLVNSMWGRARKYIPGAGIAEGAVNEYRSQLNKNLWYVGYGGDTQGQAFQERIVEEASRLWHPLAFNEEESRQAFKQATAMGYTNNSRGDRWNRRDVVDMAAKAKTSYGATVGETMRDIDMLGRNGDSNFDRFVKNMDELNKIAGEAGVNVKQVAMSFRDLTQNNAAFYGSRGANISMLQQQTQIGWGKSMQNLNMGDQTNNWQYRYMQAGMAGITTSQMAALEMTNPTRAFSMQNKATLEGLQAFLQGSDPGAWRRLQQMVSERKSDLNGPAPDITAQQIADDWWASGPRVEIPVFMQQMQLWTGKQFNNQQEATRYLILQMAGNTLAAQARKQQDQMGMITSEGKVASGKNAGKQIGPSSDKLFKSLGADTAAEKAYQSLVNTQGGSYSGAMAGLLNRMQKTDMQDHNVLIQTADGQRVMKISEAIKGGFGDQIASGRARMVGGKWAGKNLSDLGEGTDSSALPGARKSTHRKSSAGQSLSEYLKENPDGLSGIRKNPTKVTFDLTDAAKKLLKPVGSIADAMGAPRLDTVTHLRDYALGSGASLVGSAAQGIDSVAGWFS